MSAKTRYTRYVPPSSTSRSGYLGCIWQITIDRFHLARTSAHLSDRRDTWHQTLAKLLLIVHRSVYPECLAPGSELAKVCPFSSISPIETDKTARIRLIENSTIMTWQSHMRDVQLGELYHIEFHSQWRQSFCGVASNNSCGERNKQEGSGRPSEPQEYPRSYSIEVAKRRRWGMGERPRGEKERERRRHLSRLLKPGVRDWKRVVGGWTKDARMSG